MFHAAAVLKRPKNNPHSVEHDGSLPCSQEPIRRPDFIEIHFNNMVRSTQITALPVIHTPVKVCSVLTIPARSVTLHKMCTSYCSTTFV